MIDTVVKEILLRAKKEVFTGNLGNNLTAFRGDGMDFAEIKEYDFNDDVRKINWKATAKTGEVKVNVFNEERELNIIVSFMLSGSIRFGTVRLKQEVMSELLALAGFSAIKNSDRLSTLFFSDEEELFVKPTKNTGVVEDTLKSALEADVLGKSVDFDAFCDYINSTVKRKSIILIIGDFLGDVDLSKIAHRHQIYALIVRDRFEESLKLEGEYTLVDPVNMKESQFFLTPSLIKEYEREFKKRDRSLSEHFLEHAITYGKIYTDEDIYIRALQILKG